MAENEKILNNEVQPETSEPKKSSAGAAVKEFFRKQTVSLKRAPQRIPLVYMAIVTVIWLVWMFTFSQAISAAQSGVEWIGIAFFIVTLLSILVLALFLSAFPKRKKPNMIMIALIFVFLIAIILLDYLYYHQMYAFFDSQGDALDTYLADKPYLKKSTNLAIAHIVLNCVSIVLLATLPLYKKLILKINTKKVVEENELHEEIDTSAEV